jgi:hypothetical protein
MSLPRLATASEVESLVNLLCACKNEIGLKERTCAPEHRSELLAWFAEQVEKRCVWTTDSGASLAVVSNADTMAPTLLYIAVREDHRKQGTALQLIEHVKQIFEGKCLYAEPRNEAAISLLQKSSFIKTEDDLHVRPPFVWKGSRPT